MINITLKINLILLSIFPLWIYAQDQPFFVAPEGQTIVSADLHIHTTFSDGSVWPNIRVSEALKEGLDLISITDHLEYQPHIKDLPNPNRNRSYDIAHGTASKSKLTVIRGAEITRSMPPGHINAVFIEDASGAVITAEMANGPVVAFIGSRNFDNNLSINAADVIRPEAASTPASYAQDNTEYEVQVGSWVVNQGNLDNNAVLNAKITFGGTTLYDQSTASTPILAGDSAYFSLPTFSQASYSSGMYNITYSVDTTGDEFLNDNSVSQDFHISDTKFSNVSLDSSEEMSLSPFYRPSNATGSVSMCVPFMDPNASRMAAMGISFAAVCSGCDLSNRYFTTYAHEWGDVFADLDDPNAAITSINTIGTGEFTFPNDSAYQEVYVPFTDPVNLLDNQRYLFCVNTYDTDIYIGFNDDIDYNQNLNNVYKQPVSCVENNGSWYITGFGSDVTAGVSVELSANLNIEEDELFSIDAYPNPANNVVTIPLKGYAGKGNLNIMDVTGKIISTTTINANNLMTVDVTNIPNGNYIFDLNLEDGRSTKFNIVISK